MKIVNLDAITIGDMPMNEIECLGEYISYPNSTQEEAKQRVKDCDVIITNKVQITKEIIDAAANLKLICVFATGMNNVDLDYCKQKAIIVRNVAAYSTDSVAQTTFTLLLSLIGRSAYFDNYVKSGNYTRNALFTDPSYHYLELNAKTMGIIGLGAIGTKVATIASAFGMRVIYYSTSGTSHNKDYPSVSLDELLKESDVISIHSPLNERTKGLIGENELAKMKKSAVILNLGRGGIIDETALANAVDNGIIAGAALDVFEKEPLDATHPFLHLKHPERFRFSPHIAFASKQAAQRLITKTAENIKLGW